ncbi:MAG: hypothetical protein V1735_08110 [Nanoarchaeota archaeon]
MGWASDKMIEMEEAKQDERVKCPKCGEFMNEVHQGELTDGQYCDYIAGFNIPFECPACGNYDLFNVEPDPDFGPQEYDIIDGRINQEVIEDLIERAIKKRCFIEVLSLVHNVIELYLKYRLKKYIFEKEGLDEFGFGNERKQEDKSGNISINLTLPETEQEKNAKEKLKVLLNSRKQRYLHDYKEICFTLGLIDKKILNMISQFNFKRNIAIHRLLNKRKDNEKDPKYLDIRNAAKLGREIQLMLSPLNHSQEDIAKILTNFNVTEDEIKADRFLIE